MYANREKNVYAIGFAYAICFYNLGRLIISIRDTLFILLLFIFITRALQNGKNLENILVASQNNYPFTLPALSVFFLFFNLIARFRKAYFFMNLLENNNHIYKIS